MKLKESALLSLMNSIHVLRVNAFHENNREKRKALRDVASALQFLIQPVIDATGEYK